ncbi:citrate synthase [Nocardia pseudobrasiliensis]|uniref:citrate synthase (unknown stereospecificity) n=1 Tax=Nocardia pseudobrasiliensis TaxID=45979 RepID=A0A370I459_9NOCA|nr:citrate synthase [Nocardia pseudobrasiliensis]RDI65509.1 citrate synthase [Nocardia pseudobrasiliensis]
MSEESDVRHLTTEEVAQRLDIKPATVYAYVSRGLLTKIDAPGRRGSLFAEDEVVRLARRRRGSSRGGALGDVMTAISVIDDDRLFYRGHDVTELAGVVAVESVATLLWTGELGAPQAIEAPVEILTAARTAAATLGPQARIADRMRVAVTVAGASDQLRFDLSEHGVLRTARTILAVEADCFGPASREGTLGERLWPCVTDRDPRADLLDTTLTLLADHTLAVSTVAVRVAASARVHPYGAVGAGLGALDSRFHGAASTLAHRFLADAIADPVGTLSEQLRLGNRIPGFGHLVYRTRDPRAEHLFGLLRPIPEAAPAFSALDTITAQLGPAWTTLPNIDLAVAILMHAFGMRPDTGESLFALARTIGWIAHTREEYAEPPLRFRLGRDR